MKIIMPTDILYKGTLYKKNIMYSVDSALAKKVEDYRDKQQKEFDKISQAEEYTKDKYSLSQKEVQELEKMANELSEEKEAEEESEVKKTVVRKTRTTHKKVEEE